MNKLIIKNKQFKNLVANICKQIGAGSWRPDYIVGLTRGGLLPAVMISHYFDIPMQSLDISLRDGGNTVSNLGMGEDAYEGKNILVVDDVITTGATIEECAKNLKMAGAKSIYALAIAKTRGTNIVDATSPTNF